MSLLLGLGAAARPLARAAARSIAGRITIGEFVAFNAYLAMLAWPMIAFGWVTNMLQRGAWRRGSGMLEVLDAEPAIADPPADRLRATLPRGRAARSSSAT